MKACQVPAAALCMRVLKAPSVCQNDMQGSSRQVETSEGQDFARRHGCLFVETSAKTNFAVQTAFDELVSKILETPALLDQMPGAKLQASKEKPSSSLCCS